jgi:hypothetical protein
MGAALVQPPPPRRRAMVIELDLSDFSPSRTQERFLEDRTRIRLLCGGLGSGKTTTGSESFFRAVIENPGCQMMMVAPTLPMFWRLMQPEWEKACPKDLIVEHNQAKRFYRLRADVGGQVIWYGSADNPSSLEGTNLAAYWGDEVRYWPFKSWQTLVSRLRDVRARKPQGIATSTPAMGWMEEFFNRNVPGRVVFRISTRENERNLASDYIAGLERLYSKRLARSLIDGEFTVIEGQVYEAFDLKRHAVGWRVRKDRGAFLFWDFGVRKSSVLFGQETGTEGELANGPGSVEVPPESLIIFDELHPDERTTEHIIPLVKKRLAERGIGRLDHIFCDPAGNARDSARGLPDVKLLEAAFGRTNVFGRQRVQWQTAADLTWIPNGVALVNGLLDPMTGPPALYVDKGLVQRTERTGESDYSRGIVKTLQSYKYPSKERTGVSRDHPEKDGVFDHCADALRYGVINLTALRGRSVPRGRVHVQHGGE